MAGTGGRRPGAGRKPKAFHRVINQTPIQQAEGMIRDRLPWLVGKLFELAEGVHEEKRIGKDVVVVYKQPPDRQAAEYLIDRVLGKPTQPISLVDAVRTLAAQEGLTDEETAAAVAEAERIMKAPARARS